MSFLYCWRLTSHQRSSCQNLRARNCPYLSLWRNPVDFPDVRYNLSSFFSSSLPNTSLSNTWATYDKYRVAFTYSPEKFRSSRSSGFATRGHFASLLATQTLPVNRYADVLYTPQCGHVGHVELQNHLQSGEQETRSCENSPRRENPIWRLFGEYLSSRNKEARRIQSYVIADKRSSHVPLEVVICERQRRYLTIIRETESCHLFQKNKIPDDADESSASSSLGVWLIVFLWYSKFTRLSEISLHIDGFFSSA